MRETAANIRSRGFAEIFFTFDFIESLREMVFTAANIRKGVFAEGFLNFNFLLLTFPPSPMAFAYLKILALKLFFP